jgi:hypothetical protein
MNNFRKHSIGQYRHYTLKWLEDLPKDKRDQAEAEIAKQQRALAQFCAGTMAKRTAKRIIERSRERVRQIRHSIMETSDTVSKAI